MLGFFRNQGLGLGLGKLHFVTGLDLLKLAAQTVGLGLLLRHTLLKQNALLLQCRASLLDLAQLRLGFLKRLLGDGRFFRPALGQAGFLLGHLGQRLLQHQLLVLKLLAFGQQFGLLVGDRLFTRLHLRLDLRELLGGSLLLGSPLFAGFLEGLHLGRKYGLGLAQLPFAALTVPLVPLGDDCLHAGLLRTHESRAQLVALLGQSITLVFEGLQFLVISTRCRGLDVAQALGPAGHIRSVGQKCRQLAPICRD